MRGGHWGRPGFQFEGILHRAFMEYLPFLILMEPDGIGVCTDEVFHIHPVDGRWAPDAFLFPIDEDDHGFFLAPFPFGTLLGCKFLFGFGHD